MGFLSKTKKAVVSPLSQSLHGKLGSSTKTFSSNGDESTKKKKGSSLSKSLHGKIALSSKKGNQETGYSYAVVSQSTDETAVFEDNKLELECLGTSDRPSSKQLGSMLSGFYIDSFTNRNDKLTNVAETLYMAEGETSQVVNESTEMKDEPPSPVSVVELTEGSATLPTLSGTSTSAFSTAKPHKAEKRKEPGLSGSVHDKLLGSSKRAATSLSKSIHGSLPKGSLSKITRQGALGLSKSVHGRLMGKSLGGLDETASKGLSGLSRDAPLKSCLKKTVPMSDGEGLPVNTEETLIGAQETEIDDDEVKKKVIFHLVDVREYAPSISDNPMVIDGLAISLGWDYICRGEQALETFESQRPQRVSSEKELLMDYVERLRILRTTNYAMKDMKRCIESSRKTRNLRMQTVRELRAEDKKFEATMKQLSKKSSKDFEGC